MTAPQVETTPNPNSLKFMSGDASFLEEGIAAYSSREEARGDPLARRLFSVAGVEDVFMTPQFVTVSKEPGAEWSHIKPEVETILREYLEAA